MVEVGTILGGKYRVDRILGKGGMGVVLAATHAQLGTQVALKFLHPQLVENPRVTERFMREARTSAQLRGEHVCRVLDVTLFDNVPCLVMEKLDGIDLSKLLRREGPLPVTTACDYLLQACAGISEAHAAGIIHRDLKPGNLFLTTRTDGTPLIKILDFGVAKAFADVEIELTQSDMILGSPSYMSIEQIKSSKLADARSDIWSLGVILYELICGKRPFVGEGIANLALNIATEPAPPLPRGPVDLDPVIQCCLEKDPNRRYQNVAELAAAIAPFASIEGRHLTSSIARVVRAGTHSGPARALPTPAPTAAVTTPMPAEDATFNDSQPSTPSTIRAASGVVQGAPAIAPPVRRMPIWILGGATVLAVLAGVGLATFFAGNKDAPASSPAPAAQPAVKMEASPHAPAASATPAQTPTPEPPPVVPQTAPVDAGVPDAPPVLETPKPKKPVKPVTPKPRKDVGESRI